MRYLVSVMMFALLSLPGSADELENLADLSQQEFALLAEDMTAALAYRGLQPAEPYGSIGFDVGFDATAVAIHNDAIWQRAGVDASTIPLLKLSATKGLPFGLDVGGFVGSAPGTGMRNLGAQVRYALVEGGVVTPAVGLRAAVTRLEGVDQLDHDTRSLDLSLSKGFGPTTPYAGFGRIWASADPDPATGLTGHDVAENRAFAGVRFTFVVLQRVLEADRIGVATGYSARFAFGF
ncbi:MAG: hypothetical protein KY410_08110 [Proteobacteria bacterium]|nr:hypothetical protein [Pseudomonadota bacterium]